MRVYNTRTPWCLAPYSHDSLRLRPDMQRGTIESQRLRAADRVRKISRNTEVKLNEAVPRDELEARIPVGKIGQDDVEVVAYSSQFPITLTFLGR